MANKEAVFSLRVDTGSSVQDIQRLDKELGKVNTETNNVQDQFDELRAGIKKTSELVDELSKSFGDNSQEADNARKELAKLTTAYDQLSQSATDANATFEDIYGELQPLTTRLGEAEDRLYELALAGDTTSQEYQDLLATVVKYRRAQIETDMVVDNAAKTFGEKLAGGIGTATQLFSAFESVTALVGVESEELTKTMVKLQAIQGLANAVQEIQNKLKEKDVLITGVQTVAQRVYSVAVGQSVGAMKALRVALLATGIGAVIALVGTLIANFDSLKDMIFGTSNATRAMSETLDEYKEGAQSAIESTSQVGNAFELARQGVISKEEALFTYNETLGDSFGKATNLNEAERLYAAKTDAFVKSTALRAQAQALFAKAAEEQVKALTASLDDQRNFAEKSVNIFEAGVAAFVDYSTAGLTNLSEKADKKTEQTFQNAQKRVKKESETRSKQINDLGASLLKEAELIENKNGIISENEKKTQDDIVAKTKEAAEKAKKLREQQLEDAKKAWEKEKELSLKHAEDLAKIIENRVKKEDEIIRQSTITKAELMEREAARIDKLRQDEFNDAIGYLEADLINNENNFNAKRDLIEMQRLQELSNKELTEGQITAIEAKYAKQRSDLNKQEQDLKIQAVQNTLTTISNLAQLFAGGSEKQQRKAFQIQKAVSIAQATIDTYKAAQSAYASLAGVPVVGPALGAAAAAAAVSAGLLNVKNIASQKFEGGGSTGSAPAAPSLSTGATAQQLGGNATNANLNTQQSGTAELIAQSNEGTPVYVLESDITGTQNKVAMQNKLSVW